MNTKLAIIILLVLSIGMVFITQGESLFNKHVFEDDSNQYIFPFYRVADSELFNDDIFYEYSLKHNTKGVVLIYSTASKYIDPLLFSKLLPFFLCVFSTLFMFLIGKSIKDSYFGFISALLFLLHSWTFSCFAGGHAKAFAFPLLTIFIYFLVSGNILYISVIMLLQIFIYPPIAILSLLILLFYKYKMFTNLTEKSSNRREGVYCLFLFIGVILLMYLVYLRPDSFKGRLFEFNEILAMPEYYWGGRDPHFISSFYMFIEDHIAENITGLSPYSPPTWWILMISLVGIYFILKKRINVHPVIISIGISSIILYFLAWATFFQLYSPGRYLKFGGLLFLIFLSAITICQILNTENSNRFRSVLIPIIIIMIYIPFLKNDTIHFKNEGLYNYLSSIPKNALIAGHPELMDEIPLITKRKVFIQHELSLPYYKNYYARIVNRTNKFFELYYASSKQEIINICQRYGIDYIVVNKEHFLREYTNRGDFYLEPFNKNIIKLIKANRPYGYYLQGISQDRKIYEDEKLYVIRVSDLTFS